MNTMGRPTSYRPEFCELASNYCLLGATNEELAGFFDVAPRTIDNWIARIPEFAAAVRDGRAVADCRVVRSLHQRAVGYTCKVRRTVLWRGQERELTREVHYPPDVRACIFWLRNRRRQDWSSRPRPPSEEPPGVPDWWARAVAENTNRRQAPVEPPAVAQEPVDAEQEARHAEASDAPDDPRAAPKADDDREVRPPAVPGKPVARATDRHRCGRPWYADPPSQPVCTAGHPLDVQWGPPESHRGHART